MIIHFNFFLNCINLTGIPTKDLPSLFAHALNTGFNLLLGRNA
jgi:hypothetical protein